MSDLLDTFLAAHAARPWSWGTVDCCLVLADWAIGNGHPDPAPHLRETYADELGCKRLIEQRGGVLPIVGDIARRGGFTAVPISADRNGLANAVRGVGGVIGARRHPLRQWGAIFDGERWLVRGQDGFAPMVAPVLGMWSV